ncbi:MAG: acetylglucosamine transferase, partial [Cystobacter sp.]
LARIFLARGEREGAEAELALALDSVSGSDVRELTEVAALLSALGRKPDALRILSNLSAEPNHARDADLQRRTAALARELKDESLVKAACARLAGDGGTPLKCP